jgi:hypothetical protein
VAAGALAAAALGVVSAAPANAAVMVSGSLVDAAGNYVQGTVYAYTAAGAFAGFDNVQNGAFDIPLEDGTYKLEFSAPSEFVSEWYRDKPDLATADVITVAGAGQVLAPWTVERIPSATGVVRTANGRAVSNARVRAYDAGTGNPVDDTFADQSGAFRISTTSTAVKLQFSGWDPQSGDPLATEWYNDKASLATADAVTPTAAGADVGVVTLVKGGTIAGRVTNDFGAPLHRAQACTDSGCDYTDANGYYLLEGVDTGEHVVSFEDPIGEYVGEYYNNVSLDDFAGATRVAVAPGQAVVNIDAALAAKPVVAPVGVDVSGTVRDELGAIGVGYRIDVYDTPADPRHRKVVASTYSNRAGQYAFTELDRIGGETEFKIVVLGDGEREEGDFARRTTWSGDKRGYDTAVPVTAAPRTLDFTLPVAGGISGTITSEAGGVPEQGYAAFRDVDGQVIDGTGVEADGSYDNRSLWAGDYTVMFGAYLHVPEWWKDSLPEGATTVTVRPGQVTTGISAVLSKTVKAVERPEVKGDAWVGKTLRVDEGRWNTEGASKITTEWLVGNTVVATGPSLKLARKHLGKKVTARVTNDAGFAQGQAITRATAKVGYKPKVKAKVSARSIAFTVTVKQLKAKKVKATITVLEVVGKKKDGGLRLKALGKGKITSGKGVVRLKKALAKGKHKLVFRIKGKGKVGSGDLTKKVKR